MVVFGALSASGSDLLLLLEAEELERGLGGTGGAIFERLESRGGEAVGLSFGATCESDFTCVTGITEDIVVTCVDGVTSVESSVVFCVTGMTGATGVTGVSRVTGITGDDSTGVTRVGSSGTTTGTKSVSVSFSNFGEFRDFGFGATSGGERTELLGEDVSDEAIELEYESETDWATASLGESRGDEESALRGEA